MKRMKFKTRRKRTPPNFSREPKLLLDPLYPIKQKPLKINWSRGDFCTQGGNRTRTSLRDTGFWVQRVYQFRHLGVNSGAKVDLFSQTPNKMKFFFTRKSRKYLQQHSVISITPRKSITHPNNSSGYNHIQSCTHRYHPHVTLLAKGYERVMKEL